MSRSLHSCKRPLWYSVLSHRKLLPGWPQVVDAKEAGAASILGIVDSVTGAGSAVLSSFASALGMEAPVEVRAIMGWARYSSGLDF